MENSITTSQELQDFLLSGAGHESASGQVVNEQTAMRVAAVYACVRVLSETVAQLPLIVYRRTENGKERATDHPLWGVLHDQPNSWQTSFEFREMMVALQALRGNAFALKNVVRGEVRELIPIHPERVAVEQKPDFSLVYTVQLDEGRTVDFSQSEIFHLRGLSLKGVIGLSVLGAAREAIGLSLATQNHGARLFNNGARPGLVLMHPNQLGEEGQKNLRASLDKGYSGDNAHKSIILEEAMKIEKLTMTNEDAQFLETRKFQKNEIATIFRVPPHKIGDLEKATFSNIEQQSIEFVTDTVMPWNVRWEQAITRDLIRPKDKSTVFAEFLVDGLQRGDADARSEFYVKMVQNGLMSANEVRARENLNKREGGDKFLQPLNMVAVNGNQPNGEEDSEDDGQPTES